MVITVLGSIIALQSVALAAALAYCRLVVLNSSSVDEQSEAVTRRDGLLGDYQGVLRDTLLRIGIEGENIADMGARLSDGQNDMPEVLKTDLTPESASLSKPTAVSAAIWRRPKSGLRSSAPRWSGCLPSPVTIVSPNCRTDAPSMNASSSSSDVTNATAKSL